VEEYNKLKHMFDKGVLSRRQFMSGVAAIGAGVAMGTSTFSLEALAADEPKKGGTLKLGLGGGSTTDSLDPRSWTDSVGLLMGFGVYNQLVENGPNNEPIPELAESWEAQPGAAKWTFKLRKGVQFSNGKEFDADDAVYSLNLHRGETKSGVAGPFKAVKDVQKIDKYTIEITLESGDADLPSMLTDYHVMMVPNGHTDWKNPVGTGAFVVDGVAPGVGGTFNRSKNYWKAGRGWLDRVEITVINDRTARMNALLSGQVMAINRTDPKAVAKLKADKFDVVQSPGGYHPVISMMVDAKPFDNNDFRLAMKYSMDREQMLKSLFQGIGSVGNDHPIPRGDANFNTDLPQRKMDLDKAAFHLKKSGVTSKVLMQASEAAGAESLNMAQSLQQTAGKAGIKIDIKKEPADAFWSNVWLKGAFVTSYWGGRPTATAMLSVAYKAGAPWNETHWNNGKFDKLLADAKAELDLAKRKTYLWECQRMLSEEGGALIPAFQDYLSTSTDKVGGITVHKGFDMDNGRVMEKAFIKG